MVEPSERFVGVRTTIGFETLAGAAAQLGGSLLGERDRSDTGDRHTGAHEAHDPSDERTRLSRTSSRLDEEGGIEIGADPLSFGRIRRCRRSWWRCRRARCRIAHGGLPRRSPRSCRRTSAPVVDRAVCAATRPSVRRCPNHRVRSTGNRRRIASRGARAGSGRSRSRCRQRRVPTTRPPVRRRRCPSRSPVGRSRPCAASRTRPRRAYLARRIAHAPPRRSSATGTACRQQWGRRVTSP